MELIIYCLSFLTVALVIQAGPLTVEIHWLQFKEQYGRRFSDVEARKAAFVAAKSAVDQHNAEADQGLHSYYQTVNHFSIMTDEEKQSRRGFRPKSTRSGAAAKMASLTAVTPPASLDLRTCKCMTPVKDEGGCMAVYAFSATTPIEWQHCCLKSQTVPDTLSEQELIDCSLSNGGCNGGTMADAWADLIQGNALMMKDTDYPFTSGTTEVAGSCKYNAAKGVSKVSDFYYVPSGVFQQTVTLIKQALVQYGPVATPLASTNSWFNYAKGIYSGPCGSFLDHAVVIVGYGAQNGTNYWIMRNDYGKAWGEAGYIRMKQGINQCGIESEAVYPIVSY